MKKGLLLVVVMLATIAVKAQDIYVGGSLNVWRNSTGNTTSFKVAPEVGYNFNETWALGAELDYSHNYLYMYSSFLPIFSDKGQERFYFDFHNISLQPML